MEKKKLILKSSFLLLLFISMIALFNINTNAKVDDKKVVNNEEVVQETNEMIQDENGENASISIESSETSLEATSFNITINQLSSLDNTKIVELATVSSNTDIKDLTVNADQLKTIKEAKTAGVYPLILSLKDTTKEINVTVEKSNVQSRAIVSGDNITITIPEYDESVGMVAGKIYDVTILAAFGDSTTDGKQIDVVLPEGMRFVNIPSKTKTANNNPFVALDSIHDGVYVGETMPEKNALYTSYNGKLSYKITKATSTFELKGLKIAVDENLYYGPKNFTEGISVSAFMNGNSIGTNSMPIKGIDDGTVRFVMNYGSSFASEFNTLDGQTDTLSMGGAGYYRAGLLYPKAIYFKNIKATFPIVNGITILSSPAGIVDYDNDVINYSLDNLFGAGVNNSIGIFTFKADALSVGTYSTTGNISQKYTMYDGTLINVNFNAVHKINVLDDSMLNNKVDLINRDMKYESLSDDYTKTNTLNLTNNSGYDKKNVEIEFVVKPGFELYEVAFPKVTSGIIEKIQYKTNLNSNIQDATGSEILPSPTTSVIKSYYINSETLNLVDGEYITYATAKIGDVKNSTQVNWDKYYLNKTFYASGKLTNGINTSGFTINSYSRGEDGVVEESSRSTATNVVTRSVENSTVAARTDKSYNVVAGEEALISGTVAVRSGTTIYAYTDNLTVIEPTIYIVEPKGIRVKTGSFVAKQGSVELDVEENISYTANGIKVSSFKIKGKTGLYFNNKILDDIKFDFIYTTDIDASGNFNISEIIFLNSSNRFSVFNGYPAVITDINGFDLNANTTNQLVPFNANNTFVIQERKMLIIDTYINPEGGVRQPAYDISKPNTAVGFTPSAIADYNVDIFNNRDNKVLEVTTYIPVPKEGNNFGTNFQENEFKWNMTLDSTKTEIKVFDKAGNDVTASKGTNYVLSYSSSATSESNYKTVSYGISATDATSMIRVINTVGIDPGERAIIKFSYKVFEDNTSVGAKPEKLGSINDFNPYYTFDAGTVASIKGTKVGAVLQVGQIKGLVFEDKDHNGIYESANDATLSGRKVGLYIKGSTGTYTFVTDATTDAQGEYSFSGLGVGSYKIDFNTSKITGEEFTLSKKGDGSNDSDVALSGVKKGIVVDLDSTKIESKTTNAGIIKYDYINELNIDHNGASIEMLASNAQSIKTKPLNITTTPDFFDKIAATSNAISFTSANTNLLTTSTGSRNAILTGGATTLVEQNTSVTITITDIYGYSKSVVVPVKIKSNNIPVISAVDHTGSTAIEAGTVVNESLLKSFASINDTEDGVISVGLNTTTNSITHTIPLNSSNKVVAPGTYSITYDVIDTNSNTASKTISIEVVDTTAPTFSIDDVNKSVTVEASSAALPSTSAQWSSVFSLSASDIVDGNLTTNITYTKDALLTAKNVVGTYTIIANVSDEAGNVATQLTLTYIIEDTTAPSFIIVPSNKTITVEASNAVLPSTTSEWNNVFNLSATDIVDGNISSGIEYTVDSELTANNIPGTYTILADISDNAGNATTQLALTYIIEDTTAPAFVITESNKTITVEASANAVPNTTAQWNSIFSLSANDIVDGDVTSSIIYTVDIDLSASNVVGTYTILANVSDDEGNDASQLTLTYIIEDSIAPVFSITDENKIITVEASTNALPSSTAQWNSVFSLSASDIVDGNVTSNIVYTKDALLTANNIVGTYTILADVSDEAGNDTGQLSLTYIIEDTTAPEITSEIDTYSLKMGALNPTSWTELYTLEGIDIVDGNIASGLTFDINPEDINMDEVATHTIVATSADSIGNESTFEFEFKIIPITISGKIFEDANYNSKKDDNDFVSGVVVNLIDANTKEVLATTTTNDNGEYSLTGLDIKGNWAVTLVMPANYIIGIEQFDSKLSATTLTSVNIAVAGLDIKNLDAALAKDIIITMETLDINLFVNNKSNLDVTTINGSIDSVIWNKTSYATAISNTTGYEVKGLIPGSDILEVSFKDAYNRLSSIKRYVKVNVSDANLVTDNTNEEAIQAKPFIVKEELLTTLDAAQLINLANAKAWSLNKDTLNDDVEVSSVSILSSDIDVLQDITFTTTKGTSITIKMVLSSKDNVKAFQPTTNDKVQLLASNNDVLAIEDFTEINDANLNDLTTRMNLDLFAQDYNITTRSVNEFESFDKSKVVEKTGTYPIEYTTGLSGSINSYVSIINKDSKFFENTINEEAIMASDFTIKVSDVAKMNDVKIKELAKVDAWKTRTLLADNSNERLAVTIDFSELKAKIGTYNIEYKTLNNTNVKANIIVVADDVVINPNIPKTGMQLPISSIILAFSTTTSVIVRRKYIK